MCTTTKFEIGMETFTASGNALIDPGYTSILTWQALNANEAHPRFTIGTTVNIGDVIGNIIIKCLIIKKSTKLTIIFVVL